MISGLLRTTTAAMKTVKGRQKAKKTKKKRNEQLVRIGRGDLVEAEKALLFGKPTKGSQRGKSPHKDVRVCKIHPDPKLEWLDGYPLATDPVISGAQPGYNATNVAAGSAIGTARIRALLVASPDAASRAERGQHRRRDDDEDRDSRDSKIRRLEARVEELEKSTVPRISWANAKAGVLPDRPLFCIPERKLRTWLNMMIACNLPTCWSEHLKKNEKKLATAVTNFGFEDSCVAVAMVCSTGCSQAHAAWAVGLTKTHGKIHGQVVLGCVFRATIMVICYHYSQTVAQPPHLKQLDRDALPAFEAAIEPGMENNLLSMDASNICIAGKPHNPVGDGKSFSAYYGSNTGKWEAVSDKTGAPAWVSKVYGGAASEKSIVVEDNFEEWFREFQAAMVAQAGQDFTMGLLADKGA